MRLASFNLLHGRSLQDGAVDPARLRTAVTALAADVLGVQEVDRAQPRSHHLDLTAEIAETMGVGADGFRFAPAIVGNPGGSWRAAEDGDTDPTVPAYGIGLVSRLPVRQWQVIRLRASPLRSPVLIPGTRRLVLLQDEPRVGLVAVVDAPNGPLTIATTHLSFVPGWNGVQLRTLIKALREFPSPRVLLGDLNLPGPLPRWLSGWRPLMQGVTFPSDRPRVQLDHVLASGPLPAVTAARAEEQPLSDHRAVLVDLG